MAEVENVESGQSIDNSKSRIHCVQQSVDCKETSADRNTLKSSSHLAACHHSHLLESVPLHWLAG